MQFCSDLSTSLSHGSGMATGLWDAAWISANVISVYCSQVGAQLIPGDISSSSSPSSDGYYSSKFINGSAARPRQLGAVTPTRGAVGWGGGLGWGIGIDQYQWNGIHTFWDLKSGGIAARAAGKPLARCQSWSVGSVCADDISVERFNYKQRRGAARRLPPQIGLNAQAGNWGDDSHDSG